MNSLLQKNLISTKEASALSGYNADYLSRLCREKKITSSQVGRTWLIERASLEVFMETQVDRKIELAENLARERELEYRKANSSVAQVSEIANDLENRMRVAASSMLGAFTTVRIPRSMPIMSGQAFAAGLTAVILGASVTLAGSGVVARAGEMLLTSAFEARALTVAAISSSDSVARTKTAEFSKIAEDEIKKIDTTLIRAVDARVATLPVTLSEVIENSHEPVVMSELAYARAGEIFETYPKPLTATQIVASLLDTGAHPEEMFAAITREALLAYNRLGAYALNDIETVLALHMQGVEVAANGLLSASATTRDIAGRAPLAIGNVFLTASSATLSSYERAIYAYVENIDVVPSTIASTVYGLGNGIGGSVVVGMLSAPVIYEEGVVAFVEESVSAGSLISEGSFAFGKEADRTVSGLLEAEDRAIVQSVEGAKLALTSVGNGAASAVLAVESVPSFTTDKILGVMGGIALRIERADASVLSASPLVSLDIDRFIPGFLQNVTAVVAHAVGSAFHGVFGPLAGFFGASEEVGLAVIPNDGSSFSGPDGEVTTEEALRGNTTVYNGPVTIVRNEYPTVNYSGVSQAYVDERLALLRRTLYTRVVDRTSDTIYGEIRDADIIDSRVAGSTFANGAITDSTITGGTITGSSLNVASTTITGSLTVNGDIAANGITATSSVITNATSTSLFATNATLTNATSTTFYATLSTIVDGFFTNLTATLATITNAVIANLTATNATLTNATSTNATSTNLFATNFIATNATSTNLFATGARFTTGIIDALTSPLANITTAVITNLTATNSTLTNATSTNSFALSYLTPSRLLSVGSNGVATSTSLSSWVAGTLNQLTVTDNGTGGITLSLPSTIAIGTSQATTIRSDGATSTFGGGIQASIVEGGQYIAGPYVLATSTTATSAFSGNIAVGRNATFGTSASDLLTVNSAVASNLIPSANNTYDLGSTGSYWRRGYVDELTVNNLSAASTSIAGTVSSSFTINTDNATNDAEDATLIFKRGIASPNAFMTWNSTTDRFEFNMPVFSVDGIFTNATSTTSFTSTLKANTFAAGQSASTTISSTGALSTPSLTATNLSITRVPFITTAGLFTDSAAFTFDSSLAKLSVTNASTTNISNSSLTSGRVTYAGTGGLLQDSSNLLFNGTTLTANALSVTNGTTLSGALTYGGVTLANSVTGTGSMVLSASPTFTGTSVFADLTATNATSTTFFTSTLGLGSGNYFTSLLGNGLTNVGGTLTVSTSSLSSGFFLQGGNSFGTTAILGTNDAQNLAFETGGSTRITVDTSGNVGIGTTTPFGQLSVKASGTNIGLVVQGSDGAANLQRWYGATGSLVGSISDAGTLYVPRLNLDSGGVSHIVESGGLNIVSGVSRDIILSAGGSTRLTIKNDSGNVGIGTTSPGTKLDVYGGTLRLSSSNSGYYTDFINAVDSNNAFRIQQNGIDVFHVTASASLTTFGNGNAVLKIDSNGGKSYFSTGNVGIGTTLPRAKLDITDGTANIAGSTGALNITEANRALTSSNGNIHINTSDAQAADMGGSIALGGLYRASARDNVAFAVIKSGKTNSTDGDYSGYLAFGTRLNGGSVLERMRIDASGNVGIGTTTPGAKLHVVGGNTNNIVIDNDGSQYTELGFSNNGTRKSNLYFDNTNSNFVFSQGSGSYNWSFANGNVGIGTTTPIAKLEVTSGSLSSSVALNNSNIDGNNPTVKFYRTNGSGAFLPYSIEANTTGLRFYTGVAAAKNSESLTERFTILTGGNVGIGSTTPLAKLSVKGAGTTTGVNFQTTNSSDTPLVTVLDSGYVGIGTANPQTPLALNTTQSAIGITLNKGTDETTNYSRGLIWMNNNNIDIRGQKAGTGVDTGLNFLSSTSVGGMYISPTGTDLASGYVQIAGGGATPNRYGVSLGSVSHSAASGYQIPVSVRPTIAQSGTANFTAFQIQPTISSVGSGTNYILQVGTSTNANLLVVNTAGNVGIGTTTPAEKLSVVGNIFVSDATAPELKLHKSNGTQKTFSFNVNNDNAFQWLDRTAGLTRLYLTTGGFVGIGDYYGATTNTPQNKLSVAGSASIGYAVGSDVAAPTNGLLVNGNVGIGTTAPGSKLQVSTGNSEYLPSTSAFSIRKNEEGYGLFAGVSGSGNSWLQAGTANDATNYNLILQSRGGNVGIGTASPGQLLHVSGASNPAIRVTGTGSSAAFMDIASDGAATVQTRYITSNTAQWAVGADPAASNNFVFSTGSTVAASQKMIITTSGNVGIGTTTPLSKLQVTTSGADAFSLDLLTGSSHDTGLRIGRGSGANGAGIQMVTAATDYLSFYVNGSALPTINTAAQMVLTEGGNVGVGANDPTAKLVIRGGSLATAGSGLSISSNLATGRLTTGQVGSIHTYADNESVEISAGSSQPTGFAIDGQTSTLGSTVRAVTGGSERLRITSAGNVGIGTTSPQSKLDVYNASASTLSVSTDGANTNIPRISITRNNSSAWNLSQPSGAYDFTLDQDGSRKLTVQSSTGNVGINTTAPGDKLHVYDATGTVGNPTIRLESLTGGYGAGVEAGSILTGGSYLAMGKAVWDGEGPWNTTASTQDSYFTLHTTQDGTLGEKLRVTSAGYVGIGTVAPLAKLSVSSSGASFVNIGELTGATSYSGIAFGAASAAVTTANYSILGNGAQTILNRPAGGNISFRENNGTDQMTILTGGNVGIGTAAPLSKLSVSGGDVGIYSASGATAGSPVGASLYLGDSNFYNSGFYNSAPGLSAVYGATSVAGDLAFYTYGGLSNSRSEKMRVLSSGNVGIGSTTPAYKLSLYGTDDNSANTSNTGSQFAVEGDGHGIYMRMKGMGSAGISGSTYANQIFSRGGNIGLEVFSDAQLVLGSSNTERMRITAAGNVGIGTTTPQGKLAVSGGTAIFDNPGGAIRVLKTTGSFNSGDLGIWNRAGSGGNVFAIADWATGNNGVFIDTSTGNVGIGETAPSERLVVAGQGTGRMLVGDVGFGDGYTGLSMNGVLSTTNYNLLGSPGQAHLWINRATGGNIHFNENNVQQVTILSGGNVGIGESVPGYKLTVQGTNTYSTQTGQVHIADSASSMRLNIGVGVDSSANKVSWIQSTETGVSNDRNLALQPYAGKVGIGTTTPDAHLSVNATVGGGDGTAIKITNLNAGLTASPEYMSLLFNGYVGEPRVKIQATEERGNTYASQLLFSLNTGSGPNTMQERMRIVGASGNVGIGTTTPSARLTVSDSGNNIHALQIDKTIGGSDALRLTTNFSGGNAVALNPYISGVSNGGFEITLAGTQRMVIENGGDVGIGTTNPTQKFQVSKNDELDANEEQVGLMLGTKYGTNPGVASNGGGRLGVVFNLGTDSGYTGNNKSAAIYGVSEETAAGYARVVGLSFYTSGFDLDRAERMRITNTGNVGIGTTNPTGKLDIMGAYTDVSLVSDSVAIANFRTPGHVQMAINTQVGSPYTTSLQAKHTSIDGNAYPIALNPLGGNVGIGTTGPNYKLDVNGSMQVNGIWQFHSNGQFNWGSGYGSGTLTWDTGYAKIHAQGTNALKLYSANAGTGIDVVSTGFVGIGKTDPQYKLDVQAGTGNMMVRSTSDAPLLISGTDTWAGIGFYDANASDFLWYYGGGDSFAIGGGGSLVNKLSVYGNMTVGEGYNNTAAPANGMMIEGDLRVGTTTVGAFTSALDIAYTGGGTEYGIEMRPANDSTVAIAFQNAAGSAVGSISTGLSTTAYNTSSDRRLKENIVLSTRGIETLRQIGVQEYNFKNDPGNRTQGYIAQDLYEVYPEAVRVGTDISNPWSVDYGRMTPLIVKSIQDLDMRTLSLAPAAENTEAHSLAVSSDASIAGMLTVTGTGTFSDSLTAASILTEGSVTALSFLTETNETLPNEVLTGGSADLFKMASYAITSLQVLSERADLLATRLDDIDARVAALESGSTADEISGVVGLTVATIKSALQTLGIYLENGVAQFETLVFRQLAVAKDTNGDSSVGSETILAGNTVVEVENPYVLPTSKIFVTFTGPIQGAWYISNKEEGKFRVTLADGQSADVSFDYFILQTEGQLASPGAAAPAQTPNDSAPSSDPLPPVFPGEGTGTTTPVMGSGDTTPPSITLNGSAAREIDQGATWIDEGATASDETDGDLTSSIQVQGTVDTGTPGTYTVSYSVSDAAGNEAHVSRIVSVQVVSPPTAPEQPAPAPEPTPSPAPEPAP